MKKVTSFALALVFLVLSPNTFAQMNAQRGGQQYQVDSNSHTIDFTNYEKGILSQEEIDALMHMREEEKLARDIYTVLAKTTSSAVFENIPRSEQGHMDAFDQLLDRYDISDPVTDESAIGVFTDPQFIKLFETLKEKGQRSDKDAFEVGAMVEDLNMSNLIRYSNATDKPDLKLAYNTLLDQSKNHMSAFVRQLDRLGYSFEPQYISENQLEVAINEGQEHIEKEAKAEVGHAQEINNEINRKATIFTKLKLFLINLFK